MFNRILLNRFCLETQNVALSWTVYPIKINIFDNKFLSSKTSCYYGTSNSDNETYRTSVMISKADAIKSNIASETDSSHCINHHLEKQSFMCIYFMISV